MIVAPIFKPEAVFAGWLLGASFLVASRLTAGEIALVGKSVVGIVTVLALWGCFQHWLNIGVVHAEGGRAHAWFDSPNTLATLISIALITVALHGLLTGNRITLMIAAGLNRAGILGDSLV